MNTHRLLSGRRLVLAAVVGVLAFFGWQLSLSAQTEPGTTDTIGVPGTQGLALDIGPDGDEMYVVTRESELMRIDLGTFTVSETLAGPVVSTGQHNSTGIAIDPDVQYGYTTSNTVSTVDLATGDIVADLDIPGMTDLASPLIDAEGRYLYVGTDSISGTQVARIDLAGESGVAFVDLERHGPSSGMLDPSGDYAYFGFLRNNTADVVRVNLDTFTVDGTLDEIGRGQTHVVGIDADRMWVTTHVDNKLIEIDLSDFTVAREVEFGIGMSPSAAVVDADGGLAYVLTRGARNAPGDVIQVDLDDFSILGTMALPGGFDAPSRAILDPDGEYVYFLTQPAPEDGHVVRLKTGAMFSEPVDFDDVAADHLFGSEIEWLAQADITRGCNPPANTEFCPEDQVTRGQMAAFLHRALPGLATGATTDFTDDDGSVFEGDIEWLAAAGVTRGCNPPANTEFCPDDEVTRGQMAAFLVRALNLSAGDESFDDTAGHVFENDVAALAEAGVTRGCNPPANTQFCPDDPVTRGAMAAFLFRALAD